jgi:hypothetical protein
MNYAICYNVFIPLRREPSEKSEMVSQVLFGEYMEIIENDKTHGFSLVRNVFDNYTGWCSTNLLVPVNTEVIISMRVAKTFITRDLFCTLKARDGHSLLNLSAGSSITLNENRCIEIHGITYEIPEWMYTWETGETVPAQILASAKKYGAWSINIPIN